MSLCISSISPQLSGEKKKRQKLKDDWIKHKRFGEETRKIKEERKELNGNYYYERLGRDMNKIHFKLINF